MSTDSEWFEIEQIENGWHQITEGDPVLPCHTYVISDSGEAVLIDTGLGIGNFQSVVEAVAGGTVPVVLTHSHWDHIGAVTQFDDVSIHERERGEEGSVGIDTLSDEFSQRPSQFINDWLELGLEFPDGFVPGSYSIDPVDGVTALSDGETIEVGEKTLETVPIPGHSPGQIAILDREAGICHGADVLEPGLELFAHFQDSDLEAYRDTIARLIDLRDSDAFTKLTITHGDPYEGNKLSMLDDVLDAIERILAGETPFEIIETNWGATREYTINGVTVLTDTEVDER